MALWRCTACSTSYAVGLERCPQCGDSEHLEEPIGPVAWTCQDEACRAQWKVRLLECPRCHGKQMRLEEIRMPHITVHGGPSIPGEEPEGQEGATPQAPAEVAAPTPPAETPAPAPQETAPADAPARPTVNAPKAAWVDHVVGQGLDKETAEGMTKPQLQQWQPPARDGARQELSITAEAEVTRGESKDGP